MNAFMSAWQHFHAGSIPIGHLVRVSEFDLWQRFHSLPGSKRYAESETETAVILDRQNRLAGKVLGEGARCWMVAYRTIWNEGPSSPPDVLAISGRQLQKCARMADPEDTEMEYDIYAAAVTWHRGRFDDILREIADDQERVLWMSEETGAVFAPYDGGTDLILPDLPSLRHMVVEHSDWLSSYPGGL